MSVLSLFPEPCADEHPVEASPATRAPGGDAVPTHEPHPDASSPLRQPDHGREWFTWKRTPHAHAVAQPRGYVPARDARTLCGLAVDPYYRRDTQYRPTCQACAEAITTDALP